MATVAFKKGLLAALPSTYTEGTFYVTTDERAIYLDVDGSTRIRIGDFQEFATLQALQANTNPSTTALYYITELNVLAKWNGTSYVQINLDTGATSIEVVGDGNTVTAASYDPATRKITLTKGATHTTAEDVSNAIDLAIGELGNTVEGSVKKTVADEIAKVIADAPESFDTLKEISDWISSHSDDAAAMNSAITALQGILDGIGDTESGEKATVVAYVTDAIAALNIGDYAKAADLTALAGRVTTLEGTSHTHANKALLDTYTQTEENLADAVAKKHTHANATELDKIAAGDKAKWDAAEQNAKDYADSLASDYDAAGSAAEALADAKEYTDTALTWGSF